MRGQGWASQKKCLDSANAEVGSPTQHRGTSLAAMRMTLRNCIATMLLKAEFSQSLLIPVLQAHLARRPGHTKWATQGAMR
jgi:hypothetical protein